ncbi:uncharacterized protein LOC131233458 isoform X2 [Magnolia sinica]|uniref:uncharacterized protein LOC131233458 isoform X2 n=1 Tax=Magnolia sinica TaxID=86752 RepID=UPI0026583C38|nr:uncharacterized protein LOC131233458 isoform X2 [Magnolia sinica]
MVQATALLRQCPRLIGYPITTTTTKTTMKAILHHLLSSSLSFKTDSSSFPVSISPFSSRAIHPRSNGLSLPESSPDLLEDQYAHSDDNLPNNKSRNEKKREARRAVRWGMELANFSPPQIKRILRVASLEREVFDALMLVKRLGPDVREGKRRQFNYIGRLLRKVQPELMDSLIQAWKDGDEKKLQNFSGQEMWTIEEDEGAETEYDEGEEVSHGYVNVATRWFDGLVDRDSSITNEVYSIHNVEFDRQRKRKEKNLRCIVLENNIFYLSYENWFGEYSLCKNISLQMKRVKKMMLL